MRSMNNPSQPGPLGGADNVSAYTRSLAALADVLVDETTLSVLAHLDALGVPLWTSRPAAANDRREFRLPTQWPDLKPDDNAARLAGFAPGNAICGVCGPGWGFVDVDTKNGGNVAEVAAWLDSLEVHPWAKITTPSGGAHFYIAGAHDPIDYPASNSRVWQSIGLEGTEVFGGRRFGYLPGTSRPKYDGKGYRVEWIRPELIGADATPLWDRLAAAKATPPTPEVAPVRVSAPPVASGQDVSLPYARAVLEGEADELAATSQGGRNHRLNRAAYNLGSKTLLSLEDVAPALLDACRTNGLIADDGEAACRATIRSGFTTGQTQRKTTPATTPALEQRGHTVTLPAGRDGSSNRQSDTFDTFDTGSQQTAAEIGAQSLLAGIKTGAYLNETEFAPLSFVVPGLIPAGLTILAGSPKVGKSFLVLDMCLAACTGGSLFNGKVRVRQRPVLYLALEDGDRRIQSRCRALLGDHVPIPAEFAYLTTLQPQSLVGDTLRAWFATLPAETPGPLVVVDTFARVKKPAKGGTNAYDHDSTEMARLQDLARTGPDGTAVVVVHHVNKALGARSGEGGDYVNAINGTNGLAGVADAILILARERTSNDGLLSVTGRDVEEQRYAVTKDGARWDLDGATLEAAAARAEQRAEERATEARTQKVGDLMARIITYLDQHPGQQFTAPEVAEAIGATDVHRVSDYLRRAATSGNATRTQRGQYASTRTNSVESVESVEITPPGCPACGNPLNPVDIEEGRDHHTTCGPDDPRPIARALAERHTTADDQPSFF